MSTTTEEKKEPLESEDELVASDKTKTTCETCEELDHKYKLALADYQNLLRQTTKERRDTVLYANQALLLDLIPVYDNLKLAVKHSDTKSDNSVQSGLEHVLAQFKKALEEAGVMEIKTLDQPFDPTTMEAVENRENTDKTKSGLVAEELKTGYTLHNKVILPARVAVNS